MSKQEGIKMITLEEYTSSSEDAFKADVFINERITQDDFNHVYNEPARLFNSDHINAEQMQEINNVYALPAPIKVGTGGGVQKPYKPPRANVLLEELSYSGHNDMCHKRAIEERRPKDSCIIDYPVTHRNLLESKSKCYDYLDGLGDASSVQDAFERLRAMFLLKKFPHAYKDIYHFLQSDIKLVVEYSAGESLWPGFARECVDFMEDLDTGDQMLNVEDCFNYQDNLLLQRVRDDLNSNARMSQEGADHLTAVHCLSAVSGVALTNYYNKHPKERKDGVSPPTPWLMVCGKTSTGKGSRIEYAEKFIRSVTEQDYLTNIEMPATQHGLYDYVKGNGEIYSNQSASFVCDEASNMFDTDANRKGVNKVLTQSYGCKSISRPVKSNSGNPDNELDGRFPPIDNACISVMITTQDRIFDSKMKESDEFKNSGMLNRFNFAFLDEHPEVLNKHGAVYVDDEVLTRSRNWFREVSKRGITTYDEFNDDLNKASIEINEMFTNTDEQRELATKIPQKIVMTAIALAAPSTHVTDNHFNLAYHMLSIQANDTEKKFDSFDKNDAHHQAVALCDNHIKSGNPRRRLSNALRAFQSKVRVPPGFAGDTKKFMGHLCELISHSPEVYGFQLELGDDNHKYIVPATDKVRRKIRRAEKAIKQRKNKTMGKKKT